MKLFIGMLLGVILSCAPTIAQVEMRLTLNDNSGSLSNIDVLTGGAILCTDISGTECASGDLLFNLIGGDHGRLEVTTVGGAGNQRFGQFAITASGQGGGISVFPTYMNLTQADTASAGAGTLTVTFTDTDYGLGGGLPFPDSFLFGVSGSMDNAIANSLADFQAFVSPANTIPAGTLVGQFLDLSGASFSTSALFPNSGGPTGSLTTRTNFDFTGAGRIGSSATLSSNVEAVPEPGTYALMGFGLLGLAVLRHKR